MTTEADLHFGRPHIPVQHPRHQQSRPFEAAEAGQITQPVHFCRKLAESIGSDSVE